MSKVIARVCQAILLTGGLGILLSRVVSFFMSEDSTLAIYSSKALVGGMFLLASAVVIEFALNNRKLKEENNRLKGNRNA